MGESVATGDHERKEMTDVILSWSEAVIMAAIALIFLSLALYIAGHLIVASVAHVMEWWDDKRNETDG